MKIWKVSVKNPEKDRNTRTDANEPSVRYALNITNPIISCIMFEILSAIIMYVCYNILKTLTSIVRNVNAITEYVPLVIWTVIENRNTLNN